MRLGIWSAHTASTGGGDALCWSVVEAATRATDDVVVSSLPPQDLAEWEHPRPVGRIRQIRPFPACDTTLCLSWNGQPPDLVADRLIQYVYHPRDLPPPPPETELWAISHFTADAIRAQWGRESVVVPPWVPRAHFAPTAPKERVVLGVSRFLREASGTSKGQLEILRAFHRAAPPDWQLVLCGSVQTTEDGAYFNECAAEADVLTRDGTSPPGRIQLYPNLSYPVVASWYRRAAIFVHAHGLTASEPYAVEHWGYVYVKALAAGCLVLGHNSGSVTRDFVNLVRPFTTRAHLVAQIDEACTTWDGQAMDYGDAIGDYEDSLAQVATLLRGDA